MHKIDWRYIAGFFDGEGHIGTHANRARRHWFASCASIGQSAERGRLILLEIQAFMLTYGITSYLNCRKKETNKYARSDMWALRVATRKSLMLFLKHVIPLARVKRIELQDTYRFLTLYPATIGVNTEAKREGKRVRLERVIADLEAGMLNKDIAAKYGVTESTIEHDRATLRSRGYPISKTRGPRRKAA